jgi:soluble cytochrome b562
VTPLRTTSILALSLAALFLALPSAPAEAARQDGDTEEDSPLLKDMEVIQDQLKFLRRNLKKPEENPASLAALQEMQRAAVACKGMSFPMADRAEEEAKAELIKGYKLETIGLIESMLQMERALLAGDNDKARELYKDVKAFEDSGHEKYTEE